MNRLLLTIVCLLPIYLLLDIIYFRDSGAYRDVMTIRTSDAQAERLDIDDSSILNEQGRREFAVNSMNTIFNYKTSEATEHIAKAEIKNLFYDEEVHNSFADNFNKWSFSELQANHISIKSSINLSVHQTRTISIGITERLWIVVGTQLFLNRGVGGSIPERLTFEMVLYYSPDSSGLGIYNLTLLNEVN
ncbi:MAG: hypothetical protein HAW67_04215 [Endozoicomonadaceae bacterium]|nr:hypothetical protein [Endozoicomonadaceae bacterium]